MPNTIKIFVDSLDIVLVDYDQIKVYRSATSTGTYTEVTGPGTRIVLNNKDTLYSYVDSSGAPTSYYKTSYYNSSTTSESSQSGPLPADPMYYVQLKNDMQVIVTLADTITDTDGNPISPDNLQYFFTTKYDPLYSSVRKVRLEIGSFIQNLDDDAINFAIYEASLGADQLSWIKSTSDFFVWARREYVTCQASANLLYNVISGLKSKRLDNLDVTYDFQQRGQTMLDKVTECAEKWLKEIKSGGKAIQTPAGFVKGEFDPDAPHVGRMWDKGPFSPQVPLSNLRYKPFGARRYINGYNRSYTRFRGA